MIVIKHTITLDTEKMADAIAAYIYRKYDLLVKKETEIRIRIISHKEKLYAEVEWEDKQ